MADFDRLQDQLARTIRAALDNDGISQAELARMTGLSTKHINQMVQGKAGASAMFDYVAHALGRRWVVTMEAVK